MRAKFVGHPLNRQVDCWMCPCCGTVTGRDLGGSIHLAKDKAEILEALVRDILNGAHEGIYELAEKLDLEL